MWNEAKSAGMMAKANAYFKGKKEREYSNTDNLGDAKSCTILDAPLSDVGIRQAQDFRKHLRQKAEKRENESYKQILEDIYNLTVHKKS
eukprot:UN32940